MVAETTVKETTIKEKKETVEKEKKVSFLKKMKSSWKKIKFLSKGQVFKRLGIVSLVMTILCLIMLAIDYSLNEGFSLLSEVNFDIPVLKTIISVIFLILAIALIVLEVFRKQQTKGFLTTTKKINTADDTLTNIIRVISICMFVLLIIMYIL